MRTWKTPTVRRAAVLMQARGLENVQADRPERLAKVVVLAEREVGQSRTADEDNEHAEINQARRPRVICKGRLSTPRG